MEDLLQLQRASLDSCPECPVKGTCVFATPGYEPGYCLHEYKLLHAFVSQRLRARPPAGATGFERLQSEAAAFVDRIKRQAPRGAVPPWLPDSPAWPNQTTLMRFA
jgi:hypothetical protein